MTAVSTMILNSLIATGEKSIGGSFTSAEETHYLGKMNAMLDSWSVDRRLIYSIATTNFALTASTANYTIGSGGTFNMTRPIKIVTAFVRDTQGYDTALTLLQQPQYSGIKVKSVGNSYPENLYYDAADNAGLATIYLYPAPVGGLTLYLDTYQPLQSFAAMSTALVLPQGYQRAIESNFALETLPGFATASPELMKIAKESKAAIMGINVPASVSRVDDAIARSSRGNILTGP